MQASFWHERWTTNQIGFHQQHVNFALQSQWKTLTKAEPQTVLVPLCGKSHDLLWLSKQGHTVVGVELSPIAVRDFFAEANIETTHEHSQGAFRVVSSENIHLYCGDFFDLRPQDLPSTPTLVYDRAALIALPSPMRSAYLKTINLLCPQGAKMLLIALSYPEHEMQGPPFAVPTQEIERLYHPTWRRFQESEKDILAESPKFQERGLSYLHEQTYLLEKR